MKERWKRVVGVFGYEVSSCGQVRSVNRTIITKSGQRRSYVGKKIVQSTDAKGYRRVCLWTENRQIGFIVHRLVAETFLRKIDCGEEVNHIDFDKQNNALGNLEIITRAHNASHATDAGRMAKKLNEHQVREIKYSALWDDAKRGLAQRFGVSRANINAIVCGKTWKRINLSDLARHD